MCVLLDLTELFFFCVKTQSLSLTIWWLEQIFSSWVAEVVLLLGKG